MFEGYAQASCGDEKARLRPRDRLQIAACWQDPVPIHGAMKPFESALYCLSQERVPLNPGRERLMMETLMSKHGSDLSGSPDDRSFIPMS